MDFASIREVGSLQFLVAPYSLALSLMPLRYIQDMPGASNVHSTPKKQPCSLKTWFYMFVSPKVAPETPV